MSKPLTPNGQRLLVALAYAAPHSATAYDLAEVTGLGRGVRRHGRGAMGPQSWSGFQSEAFVVGRMLVALERREYSYVTYGHRGRRKHHITPKGQREAERLMALGVTAQGVVMSKPMWNAEEYGDAVKEYNYDPSIQEHEGFSRGDRVVLTEDVEDKCEGDTGVVYGFTRSGAGKFYAAEHIDALVIWDKFDPSCMEPEWLEHVQ